MQMKKFINDPDNLTAELLEGLAWPTPTFSSWARTTWSSTRSWPRPTA